jgi:uncharacterized protein
VSKFKDYQFYKESNNEYKLLPFNFNELNKSQYILTNLVGQYIIIKKNQLSKFIDKKLSFSEKLYNDLKSKHFLYDDKSDVAIDLLTLKTRTKYRKLADFTGLHIFVISLRCEHSCPYCQVSRRSADTEAFDMSIETAYKSLELVFKSPSKTIKIEFQGGEPLLNFPRIKDIVLKAEEMNILFDRNIQYVIATNLALINDDILEFCKKHDILISTSLDGPLDLHNKNRPRPGNNSHQLTLEGINKSRSILGFDKVGALMTTTKNSLGRVHDIIDEYVSLDFDSIFLRPLSPYGFAIKTRSYDKYKSDEWLEFYKKGLDYIIEINKAGHFFCEQYSATILTKILTPFDTGYVDLMSPAGIGIGAIVYNYDGNVFASDESRMLAEMKDMSFCLGNVHKDSYNDILLSPKLLDAIDESFTRSVPMCSECAFEPYCGSDPVFHHATQKDYVGHKPSSEFCNKNMAIFKHLITLMESDSETKDIFLSWING